MVPLMNLDIDPPSKVLLVAFAEVARSVAERREQKGITEWHGMSAWMDAPFSPPEQRLASG